MPDTLVISKCPICGKGHKVMFDATYQIAFGAPKSEKPYEEIHRIVVTCPVKNATFAIQKTFRGKVVAVEVKSVTIVEG